MLGIACLACFTSLSYAAYPLGDELIFYNFEDTGSTTNNSGTGGDTYDGTFVGAAATTNSIAKFGSRSATFGATNDYLRTFYGNGINPTTSSISISFWARKPGASTGCGGADDHIFGVSGVAANTRFYLRCATATNGWGMRFGSAAAANSAVAVQQGEWQHIVMVFNAADDTPKLYVNNVLRATSAVVSSFTIGDNFFLGNFNDRINNTFLEGADANIDDFALYTRALTGGEITTLFEAGSAPATPTVTATPYETKAYLSWTTPTGVITDYIVEYKLTSEPTTWTTFSDGISTTTNTTVTGLLNGSQYDFRVSAKNDSSTGTPSATVTATPFYRITFVSPTPTASSTITTSSFTASAASVLPSASYATSTHTLRLETSLGALVGSEYSTTTRYGDYNLTHLTNTLSGFNLPTVPGIQASGAAYVSTTNTIFIPHNVGGFATTTISEINLDGTLARSITCTSCGDIESITLVSSVSDGIGGYNHTFLLGTEDYTANARILRVTIPSSGASTVNATDFFQTGITHGSNTGLEGIAYNPANGKVIAVTEQPLDIYEVTLGTAPAASNVEICANLSWNAAISDFTDLSLVGNILYIASENTNPSKVVAIDITNRNSCTFVDSDGDADASGNDTGDWLSVGTVVGVTDQIEGLTWDSTGDTLYVIGEDDWFGKYRTNTFTTQNTFTGLTSGSYVLKSTFTDTNGVTANAQDRAFSVNLDTTDPTISTLSPLDNATGVSPTANLVLTFSEAVDVETGNITIKKTSDNSTIETIAVGSGLVTGTGTTTITINPSVTLADLTEYYVLVDATGFDDLAGNSYAGIASTTAWSFTTSDTTNPTVSTLSPLDNATGVTTTANLVLTFSEAVTVQTGNITIKTTVGDTTVETIPVGSGLVTGTGTTTITINPSTTLSASTEYYVQIDATAFDDTAGNSYAGIASTTAWSFTTAAGPDVTAPVISQVTPVTTPTNDTTPNYTFTTNEAGTITYGGSCSSATTSASSGSNTITLNTLTSGTYSNCTITVTDAALNVSNILTMTTFTVDTVVPIVTSVTSDKTNGSYTTGEVIDIDVTFSETVTSTGSVTVTLETGTTDRTCTFTVTSGTTGTCNYTVQAGDTTSDLTVNSVAGTVTDTAANAMTTPATPTTNLAANKDLVIDTTNPTASTLSPLDNATGVSPTANLVITFAEAVNVETGNITIKKTSDDSTVETIDVTTGQVTGDGTTTITINPSVTLTEGVEYYVQIAATAFDDTAGNSYAGIASTTAWSFTTLSANPVISTLSPADNATSVSTTANLILTFDEIVDVETGNITIFLKSDDSIIETIDVTGGQVTGTGTTAITVNPSVTLDAGTEYYVQIDATAFDDTSSNSYAGISTTTDWTFTTAVVSSGGGGGGGGGGSLGGSFGSPPSLTFSAPILTALSPADNMTNVAPSARLTMTFSKPVTTGTGKITIRKTSDDSIIETLDVTGLRVKGSGTNTISVDPRLILADRTGYYIQIDPTAFDDLSGNSFAGIFSSTTWNFTTGDASSPLPPEVLVPPVNTPGTPPLTSAPPEPYFYKTFKYLNEDADFLTKLQLAHPTDNVTAELYQNQCVTNNGKPFYRQCDRGNNLTTFAQYTNSIVCEGFVQEQSNPANYNYASYPTRRAIVTLALNMRQVLLISPTDYQNIFTDVIPSLTPITETALHYNIVSPNSLFNPEKLVTRSEALVMMMRAVCLKPDTNLGTNWQEQVARTAYKFGITNRTWINFQPNSQVMNQELYAFSSRLADYAERFGGCDTPKPEYCFVPSTQ